MLLLEAWTRNGLTAEQTAHNIGISKTTLYDWAKKFPDISNALKKNKEIADIVIENELYEAAKGKIVTLKKPVKVKQVLVQDGVRKEKERIEYVEEEVYIPPNVTAQIFWLKNRKPAEWRDKVNVEQKTDETIRIVDDI